MVKKYSWYRVVHYSAHKIEEHFKANILYFKTEECCNQEITDVDWTGIGLCLMVMGNLSSRGPADRRLTELYLLAEF